MFEASLPDAAVGANIYRSYPPNKGPKAWNADTHLIERISVDFLEVLPPNFVFIRADQPNPRDPRSMG